MGRVLALVCVYVISSSATADDRPTFPASLGDLGGTASDVWDVTEDGKFVGNSSSTTTSGNRAAYWAQESGLTNLGLLGASIVSEARWITDDGMVVGFSGNAGVNTGFYWAPDEGMVALPLPSLGNLHQIRDVNPVSGAVVGNSCSFFRRGTCDDLQGFYWTKAGGLIETVSDDYNSCYPLDINRSDEAAGRCGGQGFLWSPLTGMEIIEIAGEGVCRAYAINDAGQITGGCTSGKAFVWSSADGATTWEYPGATAHGTHICNSGRVTGIVSGGRAFTWTADGGLVSLTIDGSTNDFVLDVSPTGYVVFQVTFSGGASSDYLWNEADGFAEFLFDGNRVIVENINDDGVAVGVSLGSPQLGFIWSPENGFKALNVHADHSRNSAGNVVNHRGQAAGKTCGTGTNNCVFALWNTEPMSYGLPPVALGDLNENGSMDLAVAMREGIDVHIRDSETQELISDLSFGNDPAIAIARIPDVNGNGADEVAMLGVRPSGQVRVQVKDASTGDLINAIFYGTSFSAIDMAILPDSDGNGAPEIVVLGKNDVDAVRAQARDVLTGVATTTTYFGTTVEPVSIEILTDISGNAEPEIAMLGTVIASGQRRLQLRDSSDNSFVRNIYFGTKYEPLQVLEIGDISGDGVPDIAQLGRDPATGGVRIQTKSTVSGATIFNAYTGAVDWPISIAIAKDRNADMIDEIALLTQKPSGLARINIRDGATGDFAGNILMGAITQPLGMVTIDDLNGNGDPEFAVLGEDINIVQIQVKDVVSGGQVGNVVY